MIVKNTTNCSADYVSANIDMVNYLREQKGVYILFSDDFKDCLYVGQGNCGGRLLSHCKNDKKEWKNALVIFIDDKTLRLMAEKLFIRILKPILNKNKPDIKHLYVSEIFYSDAISQYRGLAEQALHRVHL